jgi:hypothetical protein
VNVSLFFFFRHGQRLAGFLVLGAALVWPASGNASGGGGYSELVSYARTQPEPAATADFLKGQLGILWPDTDRFYLMAAYRVMQGLPALSESEQTLLLQTATPPRDEKHPPEGAEQWLLQRNALASAALAKSPNEGYLSRGNYAYTPNCMPEAFEFAAATLRKRQKEHGQGNVWLQTWISNQDAVFASCDLRDKPVPVLMLPANAPQWFQYDFAYQKAAQWLYLGKYHEAAKAFSAIAKDDASPWHEWAAYLAIRTWWRESFSSVQDYQRFRTEVGKWSEHEQAKALQRIVRNAGDTAVRKAARGLYDAIATRFAPEQRWKQQWQLVNAAHAPDNLGQWVADQRWLWALLPESAITDDWLYATRSAPAGKNERDLVEQQKLVAHWQKTRQLPWLASAMMVVRTQTPGQAELVAASKEIKADHPLYLHLAWYRIRLQLESGDWASARQELTSLQAHLRKQSQSTRQVFDVLAMLAAPSLDELARHFVRTPVGTESGEDQIYFEPREPGKTYPDYLDSAALGVARTYLSGQELLTLAKSEAIPAPVRLRLAGEAWRRAALADVDQLENAAIKQWVVLEGGADSAQLLQAQSPAQQRFLLARRLLLNQVPGLQTQGEVSIYRDSRLGALPPVFHSADQQAAITAELKRYQDRNETEWLGLQILPWMKSQPKFAEGPAILEKLVYASRYRQKHTPTSREAFKLLHAQYPKSTEALRTRYYY